MSGKASQIDLEMVRSALALLGYTPGGGGGPDLTAEVAALTAQVAALADRDDALELAADELQQQVNGVEDQIGNLPLPAIPYAWVVFDGTADPPLILGSYLVVDVSRSAPGVYQVVVGVDFGSDGFGLLTSANDDAVAKETARTSASVDLDCGGVNPSRVTVALMGTPTQPS